MPEALKRKETMRNRNKYLAAKTLDSTAPAVLRAMERHEARIRHAVHDHGLKSMSKENLREDSSGEVRDQFLFYKYIVEFDHNKRLTALKNAIQNDS